MARPSHRPPDPLPRRGPIDGPHDLGPGAIPRTVVGANTDRDPTVETALSSPLLEWLPRRGRWIAPLALLLVFGVGVLAGVAWSFSRIPAPPPAVASPPARAPSPAREAAEVGLKLEPRVTLPPLEIAEPAPAPEPSAARAAGRPIDRAEREKKTAGGLLEMEVSSEPSGAMVSSGGVDYGMTPVTVFVPAARSTFTFRLEGYSPRTTTWSPQAGRKSIHVVLDPKGNP